MAAGNPIAVAVAGAAGRMGSTTCAAVRATGDLSLVAEIDVAIGSSLESSLSGADVVVDFTAPDGVLQNVRTCLSAGVHVVIGTTGFELAQLEEICADAQANVFFAPNFAIGAVLMGRFAAQAAAHMGAAEIIEFHHDRKLDAPSGTAIHTAEAMARARAILPPNQRPEPAGPQSSPARGEQIESIPIHSVRLPGLLAHQEVLFGALGQTLTIRHDTSSREAFMPGVLLAIRNVAKLPHSPTVGLESLLWPDQAAS